MSLTLNLVLCILFNINTHYSDILQWFIHLVYFGIFNHGTDIHALCNSPKDSVLVVQPWSRNCRDEDYEHKRTGMSCHMVRKALSKDMKDLHCEPLVLGPEKQASKDVSNIVKTTTTTSVNIVLTSISH